MAKVQCLKNGTFRVQMQTQGVQHKGHFATFDEAQHFIDERTGKALRFDVFAEDVYFKSRVFKGLAKTSRDAYWSRYKKLKERLGAMALNKITTMVVDEYVDARFLDTTRLGGNPAPDTIRLELTVLQEIMRAAVKKDLIAANPVHDADKPTPTVRRQRVSQDEILNLWKAARGEWPLPLTPKKNKEAGTGWALQTAARFLLIQLELGCRARELCGLPVLNVDFKGMQYYLAKTKAGVPQWRPLSPTAALLVREQMVAQALHFKERGQGQGVSLLFSLQADPHGLYNYQYGIDLVRDYGVVTEDFHSHACRRELVSDAIENEVDYETIMTITGHQSVASVKRYDAALKLTQRRKDKTNAFFEQRIRNLVSAAQLNELTGGSVDLTQLNENAELAGLDLMFQAPGTGTLKVLPRA